MAIDVSFANDGADLILASMLRKVPVGTYVDVGCNDPIIGSKTYYFYRRGWSGICIDPNGGFHQEYLRLRLRDTFINEAISATAEPVRYYQHGDDSLNGLFSEGENFSLLRPVTLSAVLKDCAIKEIDLLNVDVRGSELAVLQSLDFDRWRPKVVVIEDKNVFPGGAPSLCNHLLTSNGYQFVCRNLLHSFFADIHSDILDFLPAWRS